MRSSYSKLVLSVAAAAFFGAAVPAGAQIQPAPTPAAAPEAAPTAASGSNAQLRKERRAQRKAARQAARAKNREELKKLEGTGYQPNADDPNYPQNLQDATKKASGQ